MKKQRVMTTIIEIKYVMVLLLLVALGGRVYGQDTDSLGHYLEVAARNNPEIKGDFLAYKASLERVPQAGAYQDPQLDVGIFLQPMEILDGKQVADFTLMQMFPWFGTRKAARSEAMHTAKASFEKFRQTRNNVYMEVYTLWYELCKTQQQVMNYQENIALLEKLEELALRRISSPSGGSDSGMSDLLTIQLEAAEVESNIVGALSEMDVQKAKFNALLSRDVKSEVFVPKSIQKIEYVLNTTSTMAEIEGRSPTLRMINEQGLAYKAKGVMDRRMSYPMLGVGVQYSIINRRMDMGIPVTAMNGDDMIMPMVSLTIPIYRGKYKAQQRESKLEWQASQQRYTNTRNTIEAALYQTKYQLEDVTRKVELYRKQTKLAQTTYNLVIQEFVSGRSDLTKVIQIQRQVLEYRLKEVDAIVQYNMIVANVQKMISFRDEEE